MKQIFLASALTHLSQTELHQQAMLAHDLGLLLLRRYGIHLVHALNDTNPNLLRHAKDARPRLCYKQNESLIRASQAMIADVTVPSTGVGQEIEISSRFKIPVVLIHKPLIPETLAKEKRYSSVDGTSHSLELGNGLFSIMAAGCPAVVAQIVYIDALDLADKLDPTLKDIDQASLNANRQQSSPQ